jgi:anaerobic selenocysteine-containing dehydrogenase
VVAYRQLHSGSAADHADVLHFQRRRGIELSHDDAASLGVATGDQVRVRYAGRAVDGPVVVNRRLRVGVVRLAAPVPYTGSGSVSAEDAGA